MSDRVYVGRKAKEVKASPAFLEYTKVIIIVGEDENGNQRVFEAGTDTGSTLEVTNPWGTQQMANDMLARVQGYAYKPLSADSAMLTPAAELGDGITAGSEYSVLASQNIRLDTLHASDIEAPDNGELEHEMPEYASAADRQINRQLSGIRTTLKVNYDSITAEVTNFEKNVNTSLSVMDGKIESRITNFETGVNSSLSVMDGKIESKITSGEAQSLISQEVENISLSVTSDSGGTTFTLTGDNTTLSTQTLDLHVQAAYIDGTITANALVANASISSPSITGGRYWDASNNASLYLQYFGGTGRLVYGAGSVSSGDGSMIGVEADYVNSNASLYFAKSRILTGSFSTSRVSPQGTWDFSNATVTGISVTATAVFG